MNESERCLLLSRTPTLKVPMLPVAAGKSPMADTHRLLTQHVEEMTALRVVAKSTLQVVLSLYRYVMNDENAMINLSDYSAINIDGLKFVCFGAAQTIQNYPQIVSVDATILQTLNTMALFCNCSLKTRAGVENLIKHLSKLSSFGFDRSCAVVPVAEPIKQLGADVESTFSGTAFPLSSLESIDASSTKPTTTLPVSSQALSTALSRLRLNPREQEQLRFKLAESVISTNEVIAMTTKKLATIFSETTIKFPLASIAGDVLIKGTLQSLWALCFKYFPHLLALSAWQAQAQDEDGDTEVKVASLDSLFDSVDDPSISRIKRTEQSLRVYFQTYFLSQVSNLIADIGNFIHVVMGYRKSNSGALKVDISSEEIDALAQFNAEVVLPVMFPQVYPYHKMGISDNRLNATRLGADKLTVLVRAMPAISTLSKFLQPEPVFMTNFCLSLPAAAKKHSDMLKLVLDETPVDDIIETLKPENAVTCASFVRLVSNSNLDERAVRLIARCVFAEYWGCIDHGCADQSERAGTNYRAYLECHQYSKRPFDFFCTSPQIVQAGSDYLRAKVSPAHCKPAKSLMSTATTESEPFNPVPAGHGFGTGRVAGSIDIANGAAKAVGAPTRDEPWFVSGSSRTTRPVGINSAPASASAKQTTRESVANRSPAETEMDELSEDGSIEQ